MYAYFTKYCGNVKNFWKQIFVDINGNFFSGLWGHCFLDFLALLRIFLKYMYRFSLIIETVNSWVGGGGGGGNCTSIIGPTGNLMLLQSFEISYHWNVCVEVWNECDCIRLIEWKGPDVCTCISFIIVHSMYIIFSNQDFMHSMIVIHVYISFRLNFIQT